MEHSSGHQACLCAVECAIEIAQSCTIPPLKWDEFIEIAQILWDEYEEAHRAEYLTKKDCSPEANYELDIQEEKKDREPTVDGWHTTAFERCQQP